jgi:hypothetical protein
MVAKRLLTMVWVFIGAAGRVSYSESYLGLVEFDRMPIYTGLHGCGLMRDGIVKDTGILGVHDWPEY